MDTAATFPGRFESLAEISAFVKRAAREAGLDDQAIYAVELAVDEACSNIIEHAYGAEDAGDIRCDCSVTDSGLKIILRDKGEPFDPDAVPEVDTSLPLDQRQPGGAGVFLMRKVMDEVIFEFKKGENVLTLVKNKGGNRINSK